MGVADLMEDLVRSGAGPGSPLALALDPETGAAVATSAGRWSLPGPDAVRVIGMIEAALRPRWVLWDGGTALALVGRGVRLSTAWDLGAVHRLLHGGSAADPARVWAAANGLAVAGIPTTAPPDLFSAADPGEADGEEPIRSDGYLRPAWVAGGWRAAPGRTRTWAGVAIRLAALQLRALEVLDTRPAAPVTARSESAAELLCAEMTVDGLPMDRLVAESIVAGFIGPRPAGEAESESARARRDAAVLCHLPPGVAVDLRSSAAVKALLGRLGIEVADTRAWRLQAVADRHPVIGAFLEWRRAERMATTYGYGWLDRNLGSDGRLRGSWSASDGAAGRMTASAGLHNMPAELRPAVVAEAGQLFVRADLGQIEPRVLAAVSGDADLARATLDADLYLTVASQLGVDRETAKVAVLGAMYGQTTGHGARALRRLAGAYPGAVAYLERVARAAEAGRDLRTYGGRLIPMARTSGPGGGSESPAVTAARGRYGRNAVIQGAAAELFKTWAVTVRARSRRLGAVIVLCLHDELLLQVPAERALDAARMLADCLDEAVHRWAPGSPVRFVADISVIRRWSEAKPSPAGPPADGS